MSSNDSLENLLRKLRYQATAERRARTLENIFHAMEESQKPASATSRVQIGKMVRKTRTTRWALAAAVILVTLGGATFWPFGQGGKDRWWLAPPAAWGREVLTALEPVKAVSFREQSVEVDADGSPSTPPTWTICSMSKDSYRHDIYDGNTLREIQWYVPDGNDMLQHYVRYDLRCYGTVRHNKWSFGVQDPIARIRSIVGLLDKADRLLGEQVLDGRVCVGFEIRGGQYAGAPETWVGRIWFDTRTKLPVRIEQTDRPSTGETTATATEVMDQFNFDIQLPADAFIPAAPPQGFVNAHPDDLRRARDQQVKGEMVYAEVPQGLKEKTVAALKKAMCGSYRYDDVTVSFTKDAWREDRGPDGARTTKWYIRRGVLPAGPFDPNDRSVVTETMVDEANRTFRFRDYAGPSQPRHPMLDILYLARMIDRADRFEAAVEKDGVPCYVLAISAKKYGDNPDGMIHRIWLDAAGSLPVRIEFERPGRDGPGIDRTTKDHFQWDLQLPGDYFVPKIPAGFTPTDGKE